MQKEWFFIRDTWVFWRKNTPDISLIETKTCKNQPPTPCKHPKCSTETKLKEAPSVSTVTTTVLCFTSPPSALTPLTFPPLKRDLPTAHTDHRLSSSSPGRSRVSTSGRLTTSCSVSPKITLHEAHKDWESKLNYDTKARRCLSLIVLLTLPVRQQKNPPVLTCMYWIMRMFVKAQVDDFVWHKTWLFNYGPRIIDMCLNGAANKARVCPQSTMQQQQVVWAAQYVHIDFGLESLPKNKSL